MDHQEIEKLQIAERYVTGRLTEDEAARFEEHYLDCAACIERVEDAERLQRSLRHIAEEETAKTVQLSLFGWLLQRSRSPAAGLVLTAMLLIALLPAGLQYRQLQRTQQDLDQARRNIEELESQQGSNGSAVQALQEKLATERARLADAQIRWQSELETERRSKEQLSQDLNRALRPQTNTPIYPLSPFRGGGSEQGPVNQISLLSEPEWIVLSIEPGGSEYPAYRARLRGQDQRTIWQTSSLELDAIGTLVLSLHSTFLEPGDYLLHIEGLPTDGDAVPIGRYPLRIKQLDE